MAISHITYPSLIILIPVASSEETFSDNDGCSRQNPAARCSTYRREMPRRNASLCDLPVELVALVLSHIEHVKTRQTLEATFVPSYEHSLRMTFRNLRLGRTICENPKFRSSAFLS